jgi:TRAP-type C4-dicarboxylate transport system permease small subunit
LKALELLAKGCAVLAGILLVAITLMTCVSLAGRNTIGWTIVGDIELTAAAAGAAVALFLPWCQMKAGHIIVDFFTARCSDATNARLDRLGALQTALVLGLLAWRSAIGGINAWRSQAGSMMLGFPEWVIYCFLVPGLALAALIALVQAIRGMPPEAVAHHPHQQQNQQQRQHPPAQQPAQGHEPPRSQVQAQVQAQAQAQVHAQTQTQTKP